MKIFRGLTPPLAAPMRRVSSLFPNPGKVAVPNTSTSTMLHVNFTLLIPHVNLQKLPVRALQRLLVIIYGNKVPTNFSET